MDGTSFNIVSIFTYPRVLLWNVAEAKIFLKLSWVSYENVR